MKVCKRCLESKDFSAFHKRSSSPDGFSLECKECVKLRSQKYYKENKENLLSKNKEWAEKNKQAKIDYNKKYREEKKEELQVKKKEYRDSHKEHIAEKNKRYRQEHREKLNAYIKEWRKHNKSNRSEASRQKMRDARKQRYAEDEEFKNRCKERERQRWAERSPEERYQINKVYRENNADKIAAYKLKNRDKILERGKKYRENNLHYCIAKSAEYRAKSRGINSEEIPSLFLDYLMHWQDAKCFYCGNKLGNTSKTKEFEHIIPVSKGGVNRRENVCWSCLPCNDKKFNYIYGKEVIFDKNISKIKFFAYTASKELAKEFEGNVKNEIIEIGGMNFIVLSSFGLSFASSKWQTKELISLFSDCTFIWDFDWYYRSDLVKDYVASIVSQDLSRANLIKEELDSVWDKGHLYVNALGAHHPSIFESSTIKELLPHFDESISIEQNALAHGYRKIKL